MFPNEIVRFCKDHFGNDALSEKEWEDFRIKLVARHDTRFVDEVSILHILMEANTRGYIMSIGTASGLIDKLEYDLKNFIGEYVSSAIGSAISDNIGDDAEIKFMENCGKDIKRGHIVYIDYDGSVVDCKISEMKDKGY